MLFGIDPGNHKVKLVNKNGVFSFLSDIGESRERKLVTSYGDDDMVFEYKGRHGFAGSLAKYESEFTASIKGTSKANEDAQLRVLLALHRYSTDRDNAIIVGQPIISHIEPEKKAIKDMLLGSHTLTVNGVTKTLNITRVEVASECASVGMITPRAEIFHIVDLGGGTLNWATCMFDGQRVRMVDKSSDTALIGADTVKQLDLASIARLLLSRTQSTWQREAEVRVIGGQAEPFAVELKRYYSNAHAFYPVVNNETVSPSFANAAAFYGLARSVYGG